MRPETHHFVVAQSP